MIAWAVRRHRRDGAPVSLYCFPHAGGSPGEYVRWSDELPGVQVWGMHLPGRTSRLAEPPHVAMAPLVAELADAIDFTPPFVLLGHSLGALVAFETARELARRGRPGPAHLVVSCCPAPQSTTTRLQIAGLTDDTLIDAVERGTGEPLTALREDPELRALALPALRADFTLLRDYRPPPGPVLQCPVTVLAGTAERAPATADGWAVHTAGPTARTLLPGGHFPFREGRDAYLRAVRDVLASLQAPARTPAPPVRPEGESVWNR